MTIPKSVMPAESFADESAAEAEPSASIDVAVQGSLGRKLRESYEEVVRETVPDKFKELLKELKLAELKKSGGDTQTGES